MRFSTSVFFHESVYPGPLSIPLGSFQLFSKIRRDKIRKNFIFRCNVHSTRLFTMKKNYTWKFFSFIAGVVDTAEQHQFAIISANFRKKWKRSQWHTQGPGGHWFTKKTWDRKSRVRLPLNKGFISGLYPIGLKRGFQIRFVFVKVFSQCCIQK